MAKDLSVLGSVEPSSKRLTGSLCDKGEERGYLQVFETMPAQCLNAYGGHKMSKVTDKALWEHMSKPLTSVGRYMSALCDVSAERRGVGLNRWLLSVKDYCEMQIHNFRL